MGGIEVVEFDPTGMPRGVRAVLVRAMGVPGIVVLYDLETSETMARIEAARRIVEGRLFDLFDRNGAMH